MESRLIFHKLNSKFPTWVSSFTSLFKTPNFHNFSPEISSFILNHVNISFLLSVCGREGYLLLGSSIHASIIKGYPLFDLLNRDNAVVWNSLLFMYSKCGDLTNAVKVFDKILNKDTVSWNTMILGFLRKRDYDKAFGTFKGMLESGFCRIDQATLTTLLSACDTREFYHVNRMIHGVIFSNGYEGRITVGNALMTSYFRCGCSSSGKRVFDEMFDRNVVTWTAVISGLAQNENFKDSLQLFSEMRGGHVDPNSLTYLSALMACSGLRALSEGRQVHGLACKLGIHSDLCIESALMDMYSKCGSIEDMWQIFEAADKLDEVSMTVILVGCAQNGFEEEAIQIFVKMMKVGMEIDPNMVSAVLGGLGIYTSLGLGMQIHCLIIKRNFVYNIFVRNGLINMYSRCGALEDSIKVFSKMSLRNSVSWNSMIAAFARHGDGCRALELYEEMKLDGVGPTDVTFLSLLHACSHVGLVEKGIEFLESMIEVHGIKPRAEHYACVVDMLGRAGFLNEAKTFIERLPLKSNMLVCQALLGACSIRGNSEIAKYAADQLFLAKPESSAPYILLANIYSSEGRWKDRARAIKRMKETGEAKETGISWIEIEMKVHSFAVEDRKHPQAETIYGVLAELFRLMVDEGYVSDRKFILYYLDHDIKVH